MELKNVPAWAHDYEFMVCEKTENCYSFHSAHVNAWEAEQECHRIENGIIVHNVRIQGKRNRRG